MGNLCADVEIRQVGSGEVAQLRLAVNGSFTSKSGEKVEKTVYVDVDAWDKLADNCAKMVGKGCSVMVEGKLQMDEWVDKNSGHKRNKMKVRADRVLFRTFKEGRKGEGAGGGNAVANSGSSSERCRIRLLTMDLFHSEGFIGVVGATGIMANRREQRTIRSAGLNAWGIRGVFLFPM